MTEGRGNRHKKEPRGGQPKGGRSRSKTQAQRREIRLTKGRVKSALAEVEANRKWIEAEEAKLRETVREWVAESTARQGVPATVTDPEVIEQVAVLLRPGVAAQVQAPQPVRVSRETPAAAPPPEPLAVGDKGWSLGEARQMIRDGYHVDKVVNRTGWGCGHFTDLVGGDGYLRVGAQ